MIPKYSSFIAVSFRALNFLPLSVLSACTRQNLERTDIFRTPVTSHGKWRHETNNHLLVLVDALPPFDLGRIKVRWVVFLDISVWRESDEGDGGATHIQHLSLRHLDCLFPELRRQANKALQPDESWRPGPGSDRQQLILRLVVEGENKRRSQEQKTLNGVVSLGGETVLELGKKITVTMQKVQLQACSDRSIRSLLHFPAVNVAMATQTSLCQQIIRDRLQAFRYQCLRISALQHPAAHLSPFSKVTWPPSRFDGLSIAVPDGSI